MKQIQWFRVFVEGAVIVGSILLAFGIDAWWQERGERAAEMRLLSSLAEELQENQDRLEENARFSAEIEAAAVTALELASGSSINVPPDSVDQLLLNVSWAQPTRWVTGTVDAVLSGGELALLQEEALRTELAAWRQHLDLVQMAEEGVLRFVHERWFPFLATHSYLPQISNAQMRRPGDEDLFPAVMLPAQEQKVDHGPMLREREMQNFLVLHQWNHQDLRFWYAALEADITRILGLIESFIAS
jgi:outer membrane murein-binding lipoprotein Lpp